MTDTLVGRVSLVANGETINDTYRKLPGEALEAFRDDLRALVAQASLIDEAREKLELAVSKLRICSLHAGNAGEFVEIMLEPFDTFLAKLKSLSNGGQK